MQTFFTVEETAKTMKVRTDTVRRWLREGTLQGKKVGKSWRIPTSEIESLGTDQVGTEFNPPTLPGHTIEQLVQATRAAAIKVGYQNAEEINRLITEVRAELEEVTAGDNVPAQSA